MKIIIVGCGNFGTRLAKYLNGLNHDVVIIDNRQETFNNLDDNFTGKTILGIGYDKDILEKAGIKTADTLVSCSSSDAVNAVVSHIAHNIYHVPNVIARMYDNKKDILVEYARNNNLYISGGSYYHGNPKPDIEIGIGRGNLNISKEIIEEWINQ